ncbi:MAG TPA: DUF3500 domain-containing protein, partial [Bryobacteraceae bacterium]
MKHWKRLLFVFCGVGLLMAAYDRLNSPIVMTDAARAFLNSLNQEQRARASFPFTTDERMNWHFVPLER